MRKFLSYFDLRVFIYEEMDDEETKEALVYFDFPIDGRNKKWKIAKIDKDGIMLYNDEITRPVGH